VKVGDYDYLQRLAAERRQNLKLTAAEKDFQEAVVVFRNVEGHLPEQVASLTQALAERDGRLASLTQALAERDARVASLTQALAERDARVASLTEALAELEHTISALLQSRSWKVTRPLRFISRTVRSATPNAGRELRLAREWLVIRKSRLFDFKSYIKDNPDVTPFVWGPLWHYLLIGVTEGRDPHPLFDTSYYLEQNPDVAQAGVNPLYHYLRRGAAEGRDPHPLFDTSYYLEQYPDVAKAGANPLFHYLRRGAMEGRDPHPLFDSSYYLSRNPDVARAGVNPLAHYLVRGGYEGRNPHPLFDTRYYLSENPDVARSKMNPLVHYVRHGGLDGRNPHPSFDAEHYLRDHPDVADLRTDPLLHFLASRAAEAHRPLNTSVSTAASATAIAEAKLRAVAASRKLSDALIGTSALVSVIIPCFNYGKYLSDALASVLSQTYKHLEIAIVDDGSTDPESLEVLDGIRHDCVRIIRQSNQGLAQSRNNGAAATRGDYLLYLDADDRLESNAVAILLYALLHNSYAAYAYPDQRFFGDQELVWTPQAFNVYDLLWSNHPSVCSLIRRSAFNDVGGYRRELLYGREDWEFWIRLSSKGHYGTHVSAPVFEHRRHGVTMTHTAQERQGFLHSQILSINAGWYQPDNIRAIKQAWRPLISIIIPFYNTPTYLKETLASLEGQTTQDLEVILVNDGSDDSESLQLLDELRAFQWIRVVDCPHSGVAAARNIGVTLANAELIMFLDSDDLLDPGTVEKLCWFSALQPHLAFVYSGVTHFGDIQATVFDEFDGARLRAENFLTVNCVMRRDVYLELGGMDPALTDNHEDYDFWLRLVDRGYVGRLFKEPLFKYRRHSAGRSTHLIKAAGNRARALAESIVARHTAQKPCNGLRPLAGCTSQLSAQQTDPLLGEVETALSEVVPTDITRERYRRPNVPNLFSPEQWNGSETNVLYLIPSFHVGGAEAFDLRIMSCLPKDQYNVILVGCEYPDGPWYEEFQSMVSEIYSLERMALRQSGREAFIRYLMISKCVDIVVNRNTSYGYKLVEQWPLVSKQVRFVDVLHLHAFGKDWVNSSAPYHEEIDLRYVTSEDLPGYAARQYNIKADRFKMLDYGFEPEELPDEKTCANRRDTIRERWKIPACAFVVGFVGRLTDQKDPQRWLSIASEIAHRRPGTLFLVVGGGELMDQAKATAAALGLASNVVFTDYQRDAASYCAAMDVLLMTSKYEGLPLLVLHALAHGTPIVSSDVGSIRSCVSGAAGRVLATGENDLIYAKAVLEVGHLRDSDDVSVGRHCRAVVSTRFVKQRMRQQLQHDFSCLTKVLDRERRRQDYQLNVMSKPILA